MEKRALVPSTGHLGLTRFKTHVGRGAMTFGDCAMYFVFLEFHVRCAIYSRPAAVGLEPSILKSEYIKSIQVIQNQESSLSQQTCKTWRTTNAKVKANKGHPETADSFWRTSRKEIGAWLASDGSSWGAIWHVHIIHSHPTAIHLPCPDLEISKKKRRSCPTKLGQRSLGLRNLTSKHCTNTADLKSWFL